MKYRRLDINHDYVFGSGKSDYLSDVDAVAQAIKTRLLLFLGEWWEDQEDGLPMWQSILGVMGAKQETVDRLIQERIMNTQGVVNGVMTNVVTGISSLYSSLNRDTREYSFYAEINTVFGSVAVTNAQG